MSSFKKYISKKSNWAYIILFLILVIAYVFGFFLERFSYIAIGGLFLFIAVENFIKSIGYFEVIMDNTEESKKCLESLVNSIHKPRINYAEKSLDYKTKVATATNSVFFNGSGMAFMADYDLTTSIANLPSEVSVSFFATNCNKNPVSLNYLHDFGGWREGYYTSLWETLNNSLERIKRRRSVSFTCLDLFVPISYFAIDYLVETEFSFIQAKHYLLVEERNDIKVYYCEAYPGTDVYDYYLEQIKLIERSDGQLSHRNEAGVQ